MVTLFFLTSCGGFKRPSTSAQNQPVNADDRVKRNIEEGRGLRLSTSMTNASSGGGAFVFASSNVLWRATLEKLDFIPLANVDYAGGIIITDWYGNVESDDEIKIAVRFLTNEVRSDALDIKVFNRKCKAQFNCLITKKSGNLVSELTNKILKTAAVYEKQKKDKNLKPYKAN